jgi:LPXTG-site transpeptidase (sortase) family protein
MAVKIPAKLSFFLIGVEGIIFSAIIIFFLIPDLFIQSAYAKIVLPSNNSTSSVVSVKKVIAKIQPRLKIPKIKVDAILESVGLTPDGAVGVPKGPTNAAWFNISPKPGDSGSAVVTGHYGVWKNGTPTIFNNLSKLKSGDKIYVKDENNKTITFVVRKIKIYGPKDNVSEVFTAADGKSHLNLITCQGPWNKATKSYPRRLVVFTDKE